MEPQVAPLHALLELNTDLLLNCLDGLSDEEARRRLEGGGNSVAFLAAHLTDTRHFLATGDELRRTKVHRFPLEDTSELGLIGFLTQHDSYRIGQMAFLRRQLGRPAMAYTRSARLHQD